MLQFMHRTLRDWDLYSTLLDIRISGLLSLTLISHGTANLDLDIAFCTGSARYCWVTTGRKTNLVEHNFQLAQ